MPATPTSLSDLVLSRTTLDRAAHRRHDPGLLGRLLTSPQTRVLDLYGDRARVRDGGLVLRAPEAGDLDRPAVFLGVADAADVVAVDRIDDEAPQDAATMRSVGLDLDTHDVGILTTGLGIVNWQRTQGFCPRCGARAEVSESGWGRRCTREGTEQYPRTDAAVIMSVIDDDDRLLLARGTRFGGTTNRMSVLAGFVEPGESLEHAVAREVEEEVGVSVSQVDFRGDQPWPFPASLMVGFAARATSTELVLQDEEIAEARWFSRVELAAALGDGSLGVPPSLSIARHLIEDWYGGPLPEQAGERW
ncbi:NAD(+) diphosphatase [Allobranchiibius sp. GilTou73]|uniref:NAD(+) diphosphatase n=1 Tax=Allobranchiibius sp. GilTou73 TaxID=2904523 RepID=UPI001F19151A|nr:NAD(+) diphosphatase [Allobranchiibius sp. GilTou73]UIJ34722.1 NAD(+) diphosphatase [Allobranchiibius sp. GilTou73]